MRVSLSKDDYKFTFEITQGVMNVTSYNKGKFICSWSINSPSSHVPVVIEHILRDIAPSFPTEWYHVCFGYLNIVSKKVF